MGTQRNVTSPNSRVYRPQPAAIRGALVELPPEGCTLSRCLIFRNPVSGRMVKGTAGLLCGFEDGLAAGQGHVRPDPRGCPPRYTVPGVDSLTRS